MAITDRLAETLGIVATMGRARLLTPMRPDKYLRIAAAMQRENMGITSGFAAAALAAFVVLNAGASATPDVLKQHVRENLANYKVPREITILDEMPRGSTGKIDRRELQDRVGRA
jgi:non-ribosomal peptide synthetase component E (peptide arylation enzyme)